MGNLDRIERQHVSRARAYAASTKVSLMCLVFFSRRILGRKYEGLIWFSAISGFRQNVFVSRLAALPLVVVVVEKTLNRENGANGGAEWTHWRAPQRWRENCQGSGCGPPSARRGRRVTTLEAR